MAEKGRISARAERDGNGEMGRRVEGKGTYEVTNGCERSEISSAFPVQSSLLLRSGGHVNRFSFTVDSALLLILFVSCSIHSALLVIPSRGDSSRPIGSFFFVENNVFAFLRLYFGGFLVLESKGFVGIDFFEVCFGKGE